ncbi:MAG: MmgE/PrpD family protein [Bacillota bacterium]|nr:MmgE/PrpD family protein [Bacillota bacterium]
MGNDSIFSDKVSNFVVEIKNQNIPDDVMEMARLGVADFIGVALAGSKEPIYDILLKYCQEMGGNEQASIIGYNRKTSLYYAALINGAIGHILDYDDWSIAVWGHPSVYLAPTVLALAEKIGATGRDILTAYVVGFEVCASIPWIVKKHHYDQGWHITGTIGTIGAAAAASWLLKLNCGQVKKAMGIAASLSGGIRANNGTMTKPLHAGQAAANGIQAAMLAKGGFTAIGNIFEAKRGFINAFGFNEKVDWAEATKRLGKVFAITGSEGLIIKPYPSCGGTHFAIEAVNYLKDNYTFAIEDIVEIELGVNPLADLPLIYHAPLTGLEGKFSLEYSVAKALISEHIGLNDFTDETVNDPLIKNLIGKMNWVVTYPMPEMGSAKEFDPKRITIKLKNGETISREVLISKGMPDNPLTKKEFNFKFRDCASAVLPENNVEELLDTLERLIDADNIGRIMALTCRHQQV